MTSSLTPRTASPWIVCLVGCATAFIGLSAPPALSAVASCPDPQAGEGPQDCPWAGVARQLIETAQAGQPVLPALRQLLPGLSAEVAADSSRSDWKALWGESINSDAGAGGVVVHPAILGALGTLFKMPTPLPGARAAAAGGPVPPELIQHAGLEHVYGYLFSLLRTGFGYKRARWVDGEINAGFHLSGREISPNPAAGTLFSNLTYFAGNLAFRREPGTREVLARERASVAPELVRFPYDQAPVIRLTEEVVLRDGARVALRTDFVPFLTAQKNDSHLLIYSVLDSRRGGPRLITVFPVNAGFVRAAVDPKKLGDSQPVGTRYNAFVIGVTGAGLSGSRKVQ